MPLISFGDASGPMVCSNVSRSSQQSRTCLGCLGCLACVGIFADLSIASLALARPPRMVGRTLSNCELKETMCCLGSRGYFALVSTPSLPLELSLTLWPLAPALAPQILGCSRLSRLSLSSLVSDFSAFSPLLIMHVLRVFCVCPLSKSANVSFKNVRIK